MRLEAVFHEVPKLKTLYIGDNVQINDHVHIAAFNKVEIGNNVLIASNVFITDHNHGVYKGSDDDDSPDSLPNSRKIVSKEVIIEDNVWIGEFVSVLPGVRIGKGSIIGSMSVVTKDIPPNTIAVGSPARIIKKYDFNLKKWVPIHSS
jgi:lipopolysaccharide O-acetyltransferase